MAKTPPSHEYYETFSGEVNLDKEFRRLSRDERKKRLLQRLGTTTLVGVIVGTAGFLSYSWAHSVDPPETRWNPHVAQDFARQGSEYTPVCSVESLRATRLLGALSQQLTSFASNSKVTDLHFSARNQPRGHYGHLEYIVPVGNGQYEVSVYVASDGADGYLADTAYSVGITATENAKDGYATGANHTVIVGSPTTTQSSGGPNFPPEFVQDILRAEGTYRDYRWFREAPQDCAVILDRAEKSATQLLDGLESGASLKIN